MFMQSIMMGYGFGTGFQYSKRKISAMSNEEFNTTTIQNETQKMFAAYKLIIPDLEDSIRDSKELQKTVLTEMINIPANLIKDLFGILAPDTIQPSGASGSTTGTFETTQETTGGSGTTTEKIDPTEGSDLLTNISAAVPDTIPPLTIADYYKRLVYNDLWKTIPFGVNPASADEIEKVKRAFFTSFSSTLVRTLVVVKIVIIQSGGQTSTGTTNKYRIYYHL